MPKKPPSRRLAYALIGISLPLFSLAGCVEPEENLGPRPDTRPMVGDIRQARQDWAWVAGNQWRLGNIEGAAPIRGTTLRLNFKEHTWLEGDAGCNRFTASYERKADAGLQISEILSTRMFCAQPEGVMQQESRFFHLLQSVDAYRAEPDRLDLYDDDAVVLSFVPLATGASGQDAPPGNAEQTGAAGP